MTAVAAATARVAVIGAGAIAQVVHLPILTRMRGVDVAGLIDTDFAKAQTLAKRFGISRVYDSLDAVWADPALDAVVVCTPSHLHEQHIVEGLAAGKYVFCEKPLALSEQGSVRVLRASNDGGRLMVGMNQRFRPDAAALKSLVTDGELGEIRYVRAGWLNRRIGRSLRGWRHRKDDAGGGALMDLGIQMLDLSLWLLDYPQPKRIVAHLQRPSPEAVEDSAILLLELADDRVVNLEVLWTLVADRERQYLQVIGSTGSGSLSPLKVFRESDGETVDVSPQLAPGRENPFTASYRQELAHFIDAVRNGRRIETPSEQAILMKVVDGAYRSAEEGGEVRF